MTTTKRGRQAKQGARKKHKTDAVSQFRPANDEETVSTLQACHDQHQKRVIPCAGTTPDALTAVHLTALAVASNNPAVQQWIVPPLVVKCSQPSPQFPYSGLSMSYTFY
jgi:hypothetical protein